MTLLAALQSFFTHSKQHNENKTYWIAYSGGLDSHVLLHLCYQLQTNFAIKLCALHINHGLNPDAKHWSLHCRRVCQAYGIDYVERLIQIALDKGKSLEAMAREKRYAVFAEYLAEGDYLLTAHQEDDQAETVLIQLLRGAGPKGLAAMAEVQPFARGHHARPLLHFSRRLLEQYAEKHQLQWIEDDANANVKFTRNFIRHDILPLLKLRFANVTKTIARSASHCGEAQTILEEFSEEALEKIKGRAANTLSVNKLLQLSPARQRLALRTWIAHHGYRMPSTCKIEAIQTNVLQAGNDKVPYVAWDTIHVRRYRDDLSVQPSLPTHTKKGSFCWDFTAPLVCEDVGVLHAIPAIGKGLRSDIKEVSIKFRQSGEAFYLQGRSRHALKNLLQEWGVPPWERYRLPLVFLQDKLICVVGYFMAEDVAATSNEKGYELKWDLTGPRSIPRDG